MDFDPSFSNGRQTDNLPSATGAAVADAHAHVTDVLDKVRRSLFQHLRADLPVGVPEQSPDSLRTRLVSDAKQVLNKLSTRIDDEDIERVVQMVIDDVYEFGPLSPLMRDNKVSDILVNGPFQVFVEKEGRLTPSDWTFDDGDHLQRIIQRMVALTGRRLDATSPMLDARLPDGSRINATLNPPALNGPLVSIRRFGSRPLTAEDLLKNGSLTPEMLKFLGQCVRGRLNIVISGGTGSGKTTLLNALSRYIRSTERIATIEDTAELALQQPHVVKLESCPPGTDGSGEITIRALVKNSLRIRPDRIIVGECRGAEALEMLQAMNTGHEGSMTTIHANSAREALTRIELMVGMAGIDIPLRALRHQMAASIDLIVQVGRQMGGARKVVCVSEIAGIEGDIISMHEIFRYVQTGVDDEVSVGHFEATGIRPNCFGRLQTGGEKISTNMFASQRLKYERG